MTQQPVQTPPVRRRPQFRTVSVSRVQRLSPRITRVTLAGAELEGYAPHGPAEHIKVLFPAAGQERPALPSYDDEGRPVYPEGVERPVSRTYTPRLWRPDSLELDVDFVVHGDGPGSNWARGAKPGDIVTVTGPGGPYRLDPDAAWYIIAADDSALPAVGTILDWLPSSVHADVYIEVADESEHQELTSAADFSITWLHAGSQPGPNGRLLQKQLTELDLPQGDGRLFVACEASVMRDIRRQLLFERGLSREAIHTHGYWKQGVANHPDHDVGQDI